jgi:hypothetical protein
LKAGTRDQPPTAASCPGSLEGAGHVFIVLVVIVAVIMIVAVPRILRKR